MYNELIKKHSLKLVLLSGILVFFHHLSQPGFHMDGLIYAALGRNTIIKGAWLIPTVSETYYPTFHDHIPFMIILEGLFFKVFGISFFSARLFVNLFSIGTLGSIIYFTKKHATQFQVVMSAFLFLTIYPLLRHSRHPNFDMPLMFSCFMAMSFYIKALEVSKKRYWYYSGVFFGLAMLFKGPMAVFIPLTMIIHLVISKKLSVLRNITPWLGLLSGFVVFSLWPIGLYSIGEFKVFTEWFQFTIVDTIFHSRGASENEYLTYVKYLFTYAPIQMVLLLLSLYRLRKVKFKEYYLVHLIFFLVVLFVTSIMKFKLSHYITTLYPSLVIIAGLGLSDFKKVQIQNKIVGFMLIASLVLFVLPQDPKKTRDFEIFEIRRELAEKKLIAKSYVLERGAYPFWSLVSLMSFLDGTRVDEVSSKDIVINRPSTLYIVLKSFPRQPLEKCKHVYNLARLNSDAYFCE
jgi:4-amino-4-deoxy-L-arabinose transferase-like glycosyltransferase